MNLNISAYKACIMSIKNLLAKVALSSHYVTSSGQTTNEMFPAGIRPLLTALSPPAEERGLA